jgi:hypothetical protein
MAKFQKLRMLKKRNSRNNFPVNLAFVDRNKGFKLVRELDLFLSIACIWQRRK